MENLQTGKDTKKKKKKKHRGSRLGGRGGNVRQATWFASERHTADCHEKKKLRRQITKDKAHPKKTYT